MNPVFTGLQRLTGLTVVAMLAAGVVACRSASYESDGDDFKARGKFREAAEAYRMAGAGTSRASARLNDKYRDSDLSARLEAGRMFLFAGEFTKANEIFNLLAIDAPSSPQVRAWLLKSERNYSRELTRQGKDRMGVREYDQAIQLFEKALRLDPENGDARDTLARAKMIVKWRAEKGELLWRSGLRAINEAQSEVAESKLSGVADLTNAHPNADEYLSEVRTLIGDGHYRLAKGLEESGRWFGALKEYEQARKLKASPAGLEAAIARMEREVKADQILHSAEMALAKEEFAKAREKFDKALSLSGDKETRIAIEASMARLEEARNSAEHKSAIDLELQGDLAGAIDALKTLDSRAPAYNDTRERMDRLKRQLADADSNLKEARAKFDAGDLLGARAKVKAALFLQPFMPDARNLLREIETAISAKAPAGK